MWKPRYEKKQNFISRWLEERRLREGKVEETQFSWKQVQVISESQEPLFPAERGAEHIPQGAKTVYPKESSIEMRFSCNNCASAEIWIYAARKDDGVVDVANGIIKTGSQTLVKDREIRYCVDDIFLRNNWLSDFLLAQCRNGWSRVMFRTHGYNRFFVRLKGKGTWYVDMVGAP